MELQYISDLHLEFPGNSKYFEKYPIEPTADTLLIAGDLGYLSEHRKHHIYEAKGVIDNFLKHCDANWKHVYIVPGNHEYYGGFPVAATPDKLLISPNVTFLNKSWENIDDKTVIFGATLWSNIPEDCIALAEYRMNDYYKGRYNRGIPLTARHTIAQHLHTIDKLKECRAANPDKDLIVLTHHCPLAQCINKKHTDSELNCAYFTDLHELIDDIKPKAWVCGHTHNVNKFEYNGTIIAQNGVGYWDYEDTNFDEGNAICV